MRHQPWLSWVRGVGSTPPRTATGLCAVLWAACGGLALAAQETGTQAGNRGDLRVGVYDVIRAGGQGSPVTELVRALTREGWRVEAFDDLSRLSLLQYDIVYLSDMHQPGLAPALAREDLLAYVKAGGGVLQTWHHHVLGEVAVGIKRVYGRRVMRVKSGHPAVAGIQDFTAAYPDHIIEKLGPAATVLIENEDGEPVAAAGSIGRGKVVSTGLSLNLPRSNGPELRLASAFLEWLRPAAPATERLAMLPEPQLRISPGTALVPAGLPATFRLLLGPVREGEECHVQLDGVPLPWAAAAPGTSLRRTDFRLTAPAGRTATAEHRVGARVAGHALEQRFTVTGLFAPAPAHEKRGVWLHVGRDRHPSTVMPELRKLGINLVVLRIAGGTAAFYGSTVQPDVQDPLAEEGGDWLAEASKHARANGIELHPYVNNCIVEGRTSPASLERLREQGRLQASPEGASIAWFCPSHPENLEAMARPMVELATRYDIDGLQYDFIRYPNARGCFCATCRARFEKETGQAVANWPADVLEGGARHDAYVEFRCTRISALVQHLSAAIRRAKPGLRISAAVFSNWPECRVQVGQDWVRWCREGWLDFVCPMTYTTDATAYEASVRSHREALPADFPVVEGLGIASSAGRMEDPARAALHILLARQAGAAGFCGFCYLPGPTRELFEPLTQWLDQPAARP